MIKCCIRFLFERRIGIKKGLFLVVKKLILMKYFEILSYCFEDIEYLREIKIGFGNCEFLVGKKKLG